MWLPALLGVAAAAPGDADLHGPIPPAQAADPGVPLRTWSPRTAGEDGLTLLGEYGHGLLGRLETEGERQELVWLLRDVVVTHVNGVVSFGPIGLSVDVPIHLGDGGPGPGDAVVSVPVAILPERLSLVPWLRLPNAVDGRYVGDAGVGGGGLLAGALQAGPVVGTLHAGVGYRQLDDPLILGGLEGTTALAIGVLPSDALGVHAELVREWRPTPGPLEATLGARLRAGRLHLVGGAGTALEEGPGAAALRAFAGAGWSFGELEEEPVPVPVVVEPEPAAPAPIAPPIEVKVSVRDVRGEAVPATVALRRGEERVPLVPGGAGAFAVTAAPGEWEVEVTAAGLGAQTRGLLLDQAEEVEAVLLDVAGDGALALALADPEARPIEQARVLVDGLLTGTTASGGTIRIEGLAAGDHAVAIDAHGYRPVERTVSVPAEGTLEQPLVLLPATGVVRVVARAPDGPVTDAAVSFDGPTRRPAVDLGPAGERVVVLGEGQWRAVVISPTWGLQTREILLDPDDRAEARVEVVYLPFEGGTAELGLRLVDASGAPIGRAEIAIDGQPVGTSSTGGALALAGLAPGARSVAVRGEALEPLERTVFLDAGTREEVLVLRWLEGATRVRVGAPGEDGTIAPVGDATVTGRGPAPLASFAPGSDGEHALQLAPGEWTLTVSSPSAGLQARRVTVPAGGRERTTVDFVLDPVPGDAALADLALSVRDPAGGAVDGARVDLDGEPRGSTQAGRLELAGLLPGARTLAVSAPALADAERQVALKVGPQEVAVDLQWRHAVEVAVLGPDGPASDAVVRLFGGGQATTPRAVGADGTRTVGVSPGAWQVVASSAAHGLGTATVNVAGDAGLVPIEVRVGRSGASDLLVLVQDPLGQPVPDADVACPGCPDAAPGRGGAVLVSGVGAGARDLDVSAPNFKPRRVTAELQAGDEQRVVRLDPIPAPVRVAATDERGAPIDATVRFVGPYRVPGARLGATGEQEVALLPGRWEITAEAPGFAAVRRDLVVEPGDEPVRVDLVLRPGTVTVEGEVVEIGRQVHFDLGLAVLRPESEPILREVADTLVAHGELLRIEVQGHTDATGDIPVNQALSQARAAAVRDALVRLGVPAERLVAAGYGPTRPVASNADDAGRQQNRRVEFVVLEVAADPP